MEIYLEAEHAYHCIPQVSVVVARDRVEQKKVNLIAGTLGALFARSRPEELQLATVENRVDASGRSAPRRVPCMTASAHLLWLSEPK